MLKSLLLTTLVLFSLSALSQTEGMPPVLDPNNAYYIGVKGGVTLSYMDVLPSDNTPGYGTKERVGVNVALLSLIPLNGSWSFRPELAYSSQGYTESMIINGSELYENPVKQGYFHLPLMFQYTNAKGFALYSGPQAGFLVFHKTGYKRMDVAWNIGAALFSPIGLGVDARYSAGLMNTVDEYNLPLRKAKNKLLQAGLVYLFAAAKKRNPPARR